MSTKFLPLFATLLIFVVQFSSLAQARYRGIIRPDDEKESLKRVIHFYKYQDRAPVPDSIEAESKEVYTASYQPAYRIDLDGKDEADPTESTVVFSLTGADSISDEEEVGNTVVTTIVPNPEEAEDETTTLFPVVKMEELGMTGQKPAAAVPVVELRTPESTTERKPEIVTTTTTTTTTTTVKPVPECSEGDLRRQDCNTCICIDGRFFCSKRTCPPTSGENELKTSDQMDTTKAVTPEPETTTTTTTIATTTKSTTPRPECHTGVTKSVDCNMCVCGPHGKWACTKRTCIALTLREKASYTNGSFVNRTDSLHENADIDEDCNEGETKKLGCNVCVCFMNTWSCTQQDCPATTPTPKPSYMEEACQTEEDIKSMDCNVCHCHRGIWVCTKNDCKRFGAENTYNYRPNVGYLPSRNKFKFRSGSKHRQVALGQDFD